MADARIGPHPPAHAGGAHTTLLGSMRLDQISFVFGPESGALGISSRPKIAGRAGARVPGWLDIPTEPADVRRYSHGRIPGLTDHSLTPTVIADRPRPDPRRNDSPIAVDNNKQTGDCGVGVWWRRERRPWQPADHRLDQPRQEGNGRGGASGRPGGYKPFSIQNLPD